MREDDDNHARSGLLHDLASIGARAMRPLTDALGAVGDAGLGLERRAVDRVIESDELERALRAAGSSPRLRRGLRRALESDTARDLVDDFFESGLFDHVVGRLMASDALWRLVDEVAQSPSVTAAISGQGLGFADQLAGEMRLRSRRADEWLERTARRVGHSHPRAAPPDSDAQTDTDAS